jgi:hypothetical protein
LVFWGLVLRKKGRKKELGGLKAHATAHLPPLGGKYRRSRSTSAVLLMVSAIRDWQIGQNGHNTCGPSHLKIGPLGVVCCPNLHTKLCLALPQCPVWDGSWFISMCVTIWGLKMLGNTLHMPFVLLRCCVCLRAALNLIIFINVQVMHTIWFRLCKQVHYQT